MSSLKRKFPQDCPLCSSALDVYSFNVDRSILMCKDEKCLYPFDQPNLESLILESPIKDSWYSSHKKLKTQSSSSVANTVTKASDVDKHSVVKNSVKESSTVRITESSFLKKQKDLTLENATTDATAVAKATSVGLIKKNITQAPPPPPSARKPPVLHLPTNIALPPVTAAKHSNPTTNDYSLADIETLLSNDTNVVESKTMTAQPSQDFAFDCLSPSSASTINTPKDVSTMNWMDDLDGLFSTDIIQSKFNPLQGDNEFDSLLGI